MILVAGLILIGLLLFFVEFLLIPGFTVAGVLGAISLVSGIYLAYTTIGSTAGNIALFVSFALSLTLALVSLRAKTWHRFTQKSRVDSSVETELDRVEILMGDEGVAKSRLAPIGLVSIKGIDIEAKSTGAYIDSRTEVVVVKVEKARIIVKPKNS